MVYRILLLMRNTDVLKRLAEEIRNRRLPCEIGAFRSAVGLMRVRSFDHADAVVADWSILDVSALAESLAHGFMRGRLMICGEAPDERGAQLLLGSGARMCPDAEDVMHICDELEDLLDDSVMKGQQNDIEMLLAAISVPLTLKGGQYLETALKIALESPELIRNVKQGLYPAIAEQCGDSVQNVERSIRYTIEQSWKQMNSRQRTRLLPQCSHRPGNKMFLAQMLRRLEKE